MNEVFEHVTDEKATLREVARVLARGGRLILISPNRWMTVVAVAGTHQYGDVLEFFLDQGEIMTELNFLLARKTASIG